MIIKFINATILTDGDSDVFKGEVVVDNNIIKYVGDKYEGDFDDVIDCNNNILMPGFINCHAHSPMTLLKGVGEGCSLEDWLFKHIIPLEKTLTKQDIYNGTKLAVQEFLKNGITCFQDSYFYPEVTAQVCQEMGIRAVISLSQGYSQTKFLTEKQLENLYLKLKDKYNLVKFNFYFHSTYTCDEKQILSAIKLAKKYNTFVGTHASETLTEVGNCTAKNNGKTPIMLLENLGFFDVDNLIAHCVVLEKEDLVILNKYKVNIVHNPASNLKLGSGIANLKAMEQNGVNICLGTDGSASNNRLDMFREMYLASVLQKALFNDATLFTPQKVLNMATKNGAKALGYDNLGQIKQGYLADLILIENTAQNCIKSEIVYANGAENVLLTMVNGNIVYKK